MNKFLQWVRRALRGIGLVAAGLPFTDVHAQHAPLSTALPQGGQVVQGQATLQSGGTTAAPVLDVNQRSQHAVIDWRSFDLGSAATINFNQPNAQSATLNRVSDVNPSRIFGHLHATGEVTLLNPNGVYFSPSAVLDTGALTATTMQQSDADFMAGLMRYTRSGSTASIVNQGTLQARPGGYVALLAPEVRNEGLIVAQQGTVALASGEAIRLNFDPASRLTSLTVTPSQIHALVENRTAIDVGDGSILLSATALNRLQGSVVNSGSLSATSLVSKGGRIVLEGDTVTLAGTSKIDATGAAGGGTVLVGGNWQGAAGVRQASSVTMAAGATIDASATKQGDGGQVVLWSDVHDAASLTTAQGRIAARGGADGGNGGRIETSGHQVSLAGLSVDAGAASHGGIGGLWLIDPAYSTIDQATANIFQTSLNGGTSVLDDVSGNITWNSGVSLAKTAGGSATLTLRTGNSGAIALNGASISSTSNALNLVLWTRSDNEGNEGRISVSGSTITTNGGNVWMGGGLASSTPWNGLTVGDASAATWGTNLQGLSISGSSISSGAGSQLYKGQSYVTGSNTGTTNYGTWVAGGSTLSSTSGSIGLQGDVLGMYTNGAGVVIGNRGSSTGNVTLSSTSGAISITGTETDQSGSGNGWRHAVMLVSNNTGDQVNLQSTSGAITLNGAASPTSSSYTNDSSGVQMQVNSTTGNIGVVSQTGAINVLGSNTLEATNQNVDAVRFAAADAANSIRIGYDGTHPYSGNILIQGDSLLQLNNNAGAGSISVQSSGTLTFQSAGSAFTYLRSGASGALTFDDDWNFGSSLSGLTIGKTTNNLALTLSNPITVAGSVDMTAGQLNVNANIAKTSSGDATLTMRSYGDIVFNGAGISSTSGKLGIALISDWDSNNGGAIMLNGGSTPITFATNGGNLWVGGDGYATAFSTTTWNGLTVGNGVANSSSPTSVWEGVNLNQATLNTSGGNVYIAGRNARYNSGETRYGVRIQNGSAVNSGSGSITVQGSLNPQAGALSTYPSLYGVDINASTLTSTSGAIAITGGEGATDVSNSYGGIGVRLYNASVGSTTGNVAITGTTGTDNGSGGRRDGVQLQAYGANARATVSSTSGNITLTGTSNVTNLGTSSGIALITGNSTNTDANNPAVQVVSRSGTVTLAGDNPNNTSTSSAGISFDGTNYGKFFIGYDGTNADTGNTVLSGRSVVETNMAAGYIGVGGSGALTIQPLGTSFVRGASTGGTNDFNTSWSFGSGHSAVTLGKDATGSKTDTITVSNALTEAGSISLYAGTLNLNANLTSTLAGASILAKASGNITGAANLAFQTNNGDLIFWSNAGNANAGAISFANSETFNSANGSTSQASGGGRIVMAGGLDDGSNGGTAGDGIPDGYASSSSTNGLTLGSQSTATTTSLYSGGGNVLMRGSSTAAMGIDWNKVGTLAAGNGTVSITGTATNGHGIELGAFSGSTAITAAGGDATHPAISIVGTTTSSNSTGVQTNTGSMQSTGQGGITVSGTATSSSSNANNLGMDVLATSGPIALSAVGSTGLRYGGTVGAKAGTGVTASSSNITLTADAFTINGAMTVTSTGRLAVQPYSASFASALSWPLGSLSVTPTLSGLTLGKSGNTAAITVGTAQSIAGPVGIYGGTVTINQPVASSAAGDITIAADTLTFGASGSLASSGNLYIAPTTAGRTIGLGGGTGSLALPASYFTTNFVDGFAGITIGGASGAAIGAGTLSANDALTLQSGSGGISVTGLLSTGANTLTLASSGSVAESGAGAITATRLALIGSGGATLTTSTNDVGTLAGSGLGTLSYVDANALTIGSVGATNGLSASGTISVATASGNLTLAQSVATSSTSNAAVVLNAGQTASAGTAAGGDLLISGSPSVTTGTGGRATLYSGGIASSTGLAAFVGSGSGHFRYASDEATSGYTTALVSGIFAIYREQPTLTITATHPTITYGDALPTLATQSGAVNGDVLAISASAGGSTSTSGNLTAGNHTISASSSAATGLGYAVSAPPGTLVVTPKTLTISGIVAADKVYDGNTGATADATGASYAGLVNADVVSVSATGTFADRNVGTAKSVTLSSAHNGTDAGNYAFVDQAAASADITPKALTVTGSSAADKVYDRGTAAAIGGGTLVGVVGSDVVTLTQAGAFATANAGTGITVTASDSLGGGGSGNYTLTQPTGLAADITPKTLTVTGSVAADKVYDRTTTATVSGGTLQGVISGDSVTLTQTGTFASANVGNGLAVTASDSLGGSSVGNYALQQPTGLSADITPKTLTVTGSLAADKVYDRTTSAAVTGGTLQGVISGDNVTLTEVGTFATANAGNGIAVTASDSLGGSSVGNYTLQQPTGLSADITPKTLTVTGSVATDKVYNRTAAAAISGGTLQGVIAGDTVTLTQGGTFASMNVGTGIAVTASDSLGGGSAGNYTLQQPTGLAADITPKTLTVTGSVAADKAYDRTTAAVVGGGTLQGVMSGDSVTLTQGGTFATANAGTGIAVTASDSLGGSSIGNYTLQQPTGLVADITPKTLSVTGSIAADKVYDRTTAAVVSGGTLQGVIGGDTVTLTQAGTFATANAGTGITVTTSDSLGGSSVGNYTLQQPTGLAADIMRKSVTVTGSVAVDKVYDRTTAAGISGGTPQGVISGDSVTLTQAGAFATANVGAGIAVTASDSLGGNAARNYALQQPTGLSADITPKTLTVVGSVAVDKVYDRTNAAVVNGGTLQGVINGDNVTLTQAGTFATANAGTAIAVTTSDSLGGSSIGNYALQQPTGLSADITPKSLTVTGSVVADKVYDRTTTAAVSGGTLQGVIAGDNITLTQAGAFTSSNAGTGVAVTASDSLGGSGVGNYTLQQPTGLVADIAPKSLTVTGSVVAGKVYDRTTAAAISGGTLQGVIGGDSITLTQAGTFATANVGTGIAVTASDSLVGNAVGNYTLQQPTGLAADITAKMLTVTGSVVADKVYDRTTAATVSGGTLQGVVAGDVITLTQGGAFTTANADTGIAVNANDSLNGSNAGNYALQQPTGLAGDITPKALTVTGSAATSKVYDRTTAAAISGGTLQGVIAGDSVALVQAGTFASLNAGSNIAVAANDTLGGSSAGNYTLTQPGGLAADITPKTLTVSGSTANDKTYDRTTTALVTGGTLQGVVAGDAITLVQTGDFAAVNVGNGLLVTAHDALAGAAARNYTLVQPTGLAADIVPRVLALQGTSGTTKTYDGRTDLQGAGYGALTGVLAGDSVSVQGTAAYASAGAGSQAIVQGSTALTGASAGNYLLAWANGSGTITPAALTITANNDARFVTQADSAGYNGVSYSGFVNGETAAVLGGSTVVTRSNASDNAAGSYAGVLMPSGATSINYRISFVPGSYTIVPANQLLVRVANTQTTYGSAASYRIVDARYLASDGSTIVDLTSSVAMQGNVATVTDDAGGIARFTIAPSGAVLSGSGALTAGSYQLAAAGIADGSANFGNKLVVVGAQQVDAKGISLDASGATKVYDGTTAMSGLQLGAAGLAGDAVSASGTGAFASRNAGSGLAYAVTGLHLDGADAANYYLQGGTTLHGSDGVITPKAITISAPSVSRTYDGSTVYVADAATLARLGAGLVAGDTLSGLSLVFDDKNVGTGKTLTAGDAQIADGNHGANYQVRYVADHTSSITQLASVTWIGGPTGNWFDPANWAGGAVPDLSNVANVVIPTNVTVTFGPPGDDAPVHLTSLSSGGLALQGGELDVGTGGVQLARLDQSGGSLSSTGNITLGSFQQSGGTLSTAGDFSTTTAFGQTGSTGTISVAGAAHIVNQNGTTQLGNLSSGSLGVTSSGGAIVQQPGTALNVAGDATLRARNADGTPADITVDADGNHLGGTVSADGANVTVVDAGPLKLGTVTASGNLAVDSQGALSFGGSTQVGGTLTARSHGGDVTQTGSVSVTGSTHIDAGTGHVQLVTPGNRFGGGLQIDAATSNVYDTSATNTAPGSAAQVAGSIQVDAGVRAVQTAAVAIPPASVVQVRAMNADSAGMLQVQLPPAPAGTGFAFALPEVAAQLLRQETGSASARLPDGEPLPDWLTFDPERLAFSAVAVPPGGLPLEVVVRVGGLRTAVTIAR